MESLALACRVCLQGKSDQNSFFDEVEYDNVVKLSTVFKKVTMVEVQDSESAKPSNICQECTERLLNAYEFICAVEKAEEEIDGYLTQHLDASNEEMPQEQYESIDVESSDIEIQGIEMLEEEFLTEQDSTDARIIDADSAEHFFSLPSSEKCDKKSSMNLVGSRLSKRQASNYLKCSSCQRSFAKAETLERHIKVAHTFLSSAEGGSSQCQSVDDKRIMCQHCPQYFKRRSNYVRHLIASHTKEAELLTPEDKALAKTKQNYKKGICPLCGESFTQASLVIHIRRHTGDNPYQCDQCDKAFPRRQDLNIHQRQHTGEKPHPCAVCGKSFSRANKLARHMRIHTGERPYKCSKCERSFTQSNDLKIHMRRHTGEKPYKCSVCSEAFICGAALKTHRRQRNHHSPEDDLNDPFANWRVCKRKIKTNIENDDDSSEVFPTGNDNSEDLRDIFEVEYAYDEPESSPEVQS